MSTDDPIHQPDPIEETRRNTPRPKHRGRWLAGMLSVVIVAGLIVRLATIGTPSSPVVQPTARAISSSGASKTTENSTNATTNLAPNGTFITLNANAASATNLRGKKMTITALRGKLVLLWFFVAGCSSCAASGPAISKALPNLKADGVHVVSLDLYGDIPPTSHGWNQLAAWAANNAGSAWSSAQWTWGMASKSLSLAYDPSGNPDVYFLIGPHGHIRYQNSVLVSTINQLLTAAAHMIKHTVSTYPPIKPTNATAAHSTTAPTGGLH